MTPISFKAYLRARERSPWPHPLVALGRLGIDLFPPTPAQLRALRDRLVPLPYRADGTRKR